MLASGIDEGSFVSSWPLIKPLPRRNIVSDRLHVDSDRALHSFASNVGNGTLASVSV